MLLCIVVLLLGNVYPISAADAVTLSVDSNIKNGTITLSKYSGNRGDTISVIATPKPGYKLKENSLKYTINDETEKNNIINNSFSLEDAKEIEHVLLDNANGLRYKASSYVWIQTEPEEEISKTYEAGTKPPITMSAYSCDYFKSIRFRMNISPAIYATKIKVNYVDDGGDPDVKYTVDDVSRSQYLGLNTTLNTPGNISYIEFYSKNANTDELYLSIKSISLINEIKIYSYIVTAEFEPINVNYQVNHYYEQLDGSYKLGSTDTQSALTDSKVSITDLIKSILGFNKLKATN